MYGNTQNTGERWQSMHLRLMHEPRCLQSAGLNFPPSSAPRHRGRFEIYRRLEQPCKDPCEEIAFRKFVESLSIDTREIGFENQ